MPRTPEQIDRLLDAIELINEDQREEAQTLLRELIQEDNGFEEAWLWMSIAVDSLDQSQICLDHVLRINPNNFQAAGALYRVRESEMIQERQRNRYLMIRNTSFLLMWLLIICGIVAVFITSANHYYALTYLAR